MSTTDLTYNADCPCCNPVWVPDSAARLTVAEGYSAWLDEHHPDGGATWRTSVASWLRDHLTEPAVQTLLVEHPTVAVWVTEATEVAA